MLFFFLIYFSYNYCSLDSRNVQEGLALMRALLFNLTLNLVYLKDAADNLTRNRVFTYSYSKNS